jgi:hypothetical protein
VNTLPTEPAWAGKRVNYGKDRCAYIPKSQQAAAQAAQAVAAQSLVAQSAAASLSPINTNVGGFGRSDLIRLSRPMDSQLPGAQIGPSTSATFIPRRQRRTCAIPLEEACYRAYGICRTNTSRCVSCFILFIVAAIYRIYTSVCDVYRPCRGPHILPCRVLSGTDTQQSSAQARMG